MYSSLRGFCLARRETFESLLNRFRNRVSSPQFIVSAILLVVLSYLILVPVYGLTVRTLTWTESDLRFSRDAVSGTLTLFHWKNLFLGPLAKKFFTVPLVNTLVTGIVPSVLAVILGGILSWLVVKTNLPGRNLFRTLLTLPYVIPAFALSLAWETLFRSPKIGGKPGFFEVIFGVTPPDWLSYGPVPIIITMTIHYFPFALLLVSGALATIDNQLEECAQIQGASRWVVIVKITFPIVAPAFIAAFVLTLGKTLSTFALPFLLGAPVGYYTLSTMLFNSFTLGFEANGYILALVVIGLATIILIVSTRVLGGNLRRFETIGGKGFKSNPVMLRQWRWPVFGLVSFFTIVVVLFPIVLLMYQSVMLVDGLYGLDNLSLHYWIGHSKPDVAFGEPGVMHNPIILGAAWNSIKLAVISSSICAVSGLLIAYTIIRGQNSKISVLLEKISFLPFLFPAMAFGAMYLSMFATRQGPIPALYGSFTLLVLISVINRLPYATRTGMSAVTQISKELEEAAEVQGASSFTRFRRIVFPLAMPGVVSGMMVSFIGIMRELSLIILLITPATRVLITLGFRYAEEGLTQLGNALVLMVVFITMVGELIIWWLGKGPLARLR